MVLARCRKMPVFQKNKPGADVAFCHLGVAFLDEPKHIANVDFTPRAPRPRYRQIQLQGDWTRAKHNNAAFLRSWHVLLDCFSEFQAGGDRMIRSRDENNPLAMASDRVQRRSRDGSSCVASDRFGDGTSTRKANSGKVRPDAVCVPLRCYQMDGNLGVAASGCPPETAAIARNQLPHSIQKRKFDQSLCLQPAQARHRSPTRFPLPAQFARVAAENSLQNKAI